MSAKSPVTRLSRRSIRNVFLACAALTASLAARASANNLLGNADFETPVAFPNDVAASNQGGGNIGSGGQGDWIAVAGNTFYTQTHFLTGVQSGKMFGNVGLFQQTVQVGHDFDNFTASIMMLNASNDFLKGSEGGFINMDYYDGDGNKLATVTGQEELSFLSSKDTQDVWKLVTVTAPGLPNTAYVQVDLVAGPFSGVTGAAGGAVFVDDADFEVTGPSASNWLSPTNGSWASSGNWSDSAVPQHTTDHAVFGPVNNSSPTIVALDGNFTVDGLSFDSSNSYSITPGDGGSLTLSSTTGAVPVFVNNGNHSISANLTLSSPTIVNVVNPTDSLTLSGSVTYSSTAAGTSLMKAGAGTLTMAQLNFPSVSIAAGTLKIAPNGTTSGVSVVGALGIHAGATLDLSDNDLLIPYAGNVSPAATIRAYLKSAYNGGAWNGTGLTSSNAQSDHRTALGYAEATDVGITTFDGQLITTPFAVVVKYTYYGDSSLDGKVDLGNDFNLFLIGYLSNGSTWELGDYNYDGLVNAADFGLFVDGYKTQGASLGSLDDVIEGSALLSAAQKAQLISAVPEPASAAILGAIALTPLLARRRGKNVRRR